jgi:hypothetical protein
MTLSIVQSMSIWGSSAGATVSYHSATTGGNLLLAFATNNFSEGPILTPSSWTQVFQANSGVEGGLWYKYTSGGETSSTWRDTDGGDNIAVAIYEIHGADPSDPIDQYSYNGSYEYSTPVTPTVVGDLALGTAFVNSIPSGAAYITPAGWVNDCFQSNIGSYHGLTAGHQTLLTTDTSTPINPTFSWGGDSGMTVVVLIQPPTGGPPPGPPIPSFMVV